jgi:uncharacterized protein YceK
MKRLFLVVAVAATLSGCASADYGRYIDAHIASQTAKSNADAAKYRAMADIAQSGDTTAKVAAMMAMQVHNNQNTQQIVAPKSPTDTVMQALGIFVPAIVQGYGIHANQNIATTQSNNSRDVAISTNSAFVGIASQIQAPAANMTINGSGTIGSGSYATDTHAITNSYNPVDNSNQGNPVDNSNQGNPITYPTVIAIP